MIGLKAGLPSRGTDRLDEWVNRKIMKCSENKCKVLCLWRKKPLKWCRLVAAWEADLQKGLGSRAGP